MNILFFLIPKKETACVYSDDSLRQVMEKLEHHGYTAIPILTMDGEYVGTITEGDLLWKMKEMNFPNLREMEKISVMEIPRHRDNEAVHVGAEMNDLLDKVLRQNFVPVVDDQNVFIGIVTRKEVMTYLRDGQKDK